MFKWLRSLPLVPSVFPVPIILLRFPPNTPSPLSLHILLRSVERREKIYFFLWVFIHLQNSTPLWLGNVGGFQGVAVWVVVSALCHFVLHAMCIYCYYCTFFNFPLSTWASLRSPLPLISITLPLSSAHPVRILHIYILHIDFFFSVISCHLAICFLDVSLHGEKLGVLSVCYRSIEHYLHGISLDETTAVLGQWDLFCFNKQ